MISSSCSISRSCMYEKLGVFLRVRQDLDDRRDRSSWSSTAKPLPFQSDPKRRPPAIGSSNRSCKPLEGEFVILESVRESFRPSPRRQFELAKLHRLKTTRRIQLVAKFQKPDLCHRFQKMYLCYQYFFDRHDARKQWLARNSRPSLDPFDRRVESRAGSA